MFDQNQDNTLIIFLKYPEPGRVKTRLAKDIGETQAARIYSEMAKKVIDKASQSNDYRKLVFFSPSYRRVETKKWLENYRLNLFPQEGKSLGERMCSAFEIAFSQGAKKVVIIGTDCPDISADLISEAFNSLWRVDAVIGPAEDGGYYLLGLNRVIPEIFREIDWGTSRVLDQTRGKIKNLGISFELLKVLKDIDTINDLGSYSISQTLITKRRRKIK